MFKAGFSFLEQRKSALKMENIRGAQNLDLLGWYYFPEAIK